MNWFDDWALTLAVFVPLVGMAIVLLIPKAEEELIKVVALLTSLVTLAVGSASWPTSTTTSRGCNSW